ncbi:hypothetical protein FKM82_017753 [Ascaphus truei]
MEGPEESGGTEPVTAPGTGEKSVGTEPVTAPESSGTEPVKTPGTGEKSGGTEPIIAAESGGTEPVIAPESGGTEPATAPETGGNGDKEPVTSEAKREGEDAPSPANTGEDGGNERTAADTGEEDGKELRAAGTGEEDITQQEDAVTGKERGTQPAAVDSEGSETSPNLHGEEEMALLPSEEPAGTEEGGGKTITEEGAEGDTTETQGENKEDSDEGETEPQGEDEEETAPQAVESEADEDQARDELIQRYQTTVLERDKIQQKNAQLQNKLCEYFRRKKGEDTRPEMEKQTSDLEQRYLKYLSTLEELRKQNTLEATFHQRQTEELRDHCQEVLNRVDQEWSCFQEQKKMLALFGMRHRCAGKHASPAVVEVIEQLQTKEERKEKELIQVRLENIKLKNNIRHFESILRAKEELADGLHLIDFEQLKIENQTYNEKIEERNEELLKLRKKITSTVQVLTHLKEKLQFVQAENQDKKDTLMEVEADVAHKRDILTKTKQARDSLRIDNLKLKQKCGLLGNNLLLRDFEDKVDATEELGQRLEGLKRRHAEFTLSSKGLLKKIDKVKLMRK